MISTANIKSGELTPAEKKEKIQQHRKYHEALFKQLNISESDYNVKLVFLNNNRKVIGVFPNEFKKEKGFYLEFVDKQLNPTDTERTVYKLNPSENYESVYNLLSTGSYAVPIDELEPVNIRRSAAYPPEFTINLNDLRANRELEDDPLSRMTIRDLAAILWQSPVSNKQWLNNLITDIKEQI